MSRNPAFVPPSHDNLVNEHGEMMSSALDNVMTSQPQSYDDFMKGFTYLTKDDVAVGPDLSISSPSLNKQNRDIVSKTRKITRTISKSEERDHNTDADTVPQQDADADSSEDLEEEVLEEGTKSSIMSSTNASLCASGKLKFDNFVGSDNEENSEDADSDLDLGGYVASFGNAGNTSEVIDDIKEKPVPKHYEEHELAEKNCGSSNSQEKADNSEESSDTETDARVVHLYPGEIEEDCMDPTVGELQNDRVLDFSARVSETPSVSEVEDGNREVCSDTVEPFSLDEDFDYDNVILTPKFSTEDMNLMRTLMEHSAISSNS